MVDSTGKDILIEALERICREHRAMTRILAEDNPKWRIPVRSLTDSKPNADAIHTRFSEVIDSQQSSRDNVIDIALLIKALNKTTL